MLENAPNFEAYLEGLGKLEVRGPRIVERGAVTTKIYTLLLNGKKIGSYKESTNKEDMIFTQIFDATEEGIPGYEYDNGVKKRKDIFLQWFSTETRKWRSDFHTAIPFP